MFVVKVPERHRRCVVCSDLHCIEGSKCWQLQMVLAAVLAEDTDCLLILGDLFERLHYELTPEELKKHFEKLTGGTRLPSHVYFATSLSSHDPILPAPVRFELNSSEILAVPGVIHLHAGGHDICGLHGDLVVSSGVLAYLLNRLASMAGKKLLLEEISKQRFCRDSEWVFTGHTHVPGLDTARKLGNPGSWKIAWKGGLPYWKTPSFTLIKVSDSEVRLLRVL